MFALLISDKLEEKICVVQIEKGDNELQSIYDTIECNTIDVIQIAEIGRGKSLDFIIDDEGRFTNDMPNMHTVIPFLKGKTTSPLFGKVLVTTTDLNTVETIDTDISIAKHTLMRVLGFEIEQFAY